MILPLFFFTFLINLFSLLISLFLGCTDGDKNSQTASDKQPANSKESPQTSLTEKKEPQKLVIEDVKVGEGEEAKPGQKVSVHYTGKLISGKEFDSSHNRKTPFVFQLGKGMVIPGWDQGVAGMKVGGKRILTIPSQLAYGKRGVPGVIPADSTLIFEVELLEIKK